MKRFLFSVMACALLLPSLALAADLKISELPSASGVNSNDLLVIDQGGVTKKIDAGLVRGVVTQHSSRTLASPYGCSSGWKTRELQSEVADLVAAGYNADYIFCTEVTGGGVSLMPTGMSMSIGFNAPTVLGGGSVGLSPSGMNIGVGFNAPTVSVIGGDVNLTPSGMTLAMGFNTPQVSGGASGASDTFDGTGALSGNWTVPSGFSAPTRSTDVVIGVAINPSRAVWTGAGVSSDNQYASIGYVNWGSLDRPWGTGVRVSTTADTGYFCVMSQHEYTDGDENYWNGMRTQVYKVIDGTVTSLNLQEDVAYSAGVRLEVNGTTITCKDAGNTTIWSGTDSSITTGKPAITFAINGNVSQADNFLAGDL